MAGLLELVIPMMKWIVFFFLPMVCRWRLLSKPIARQMLAAAASQGESR